MQNNYDSLVESIYVQKIENGSQFDIGNDFKISFVVDKHLNWFQKLMWNWCFGVKVEDYSNEQDIENAKRKN